MSTAVPSYPVSHVILELLPYVVAGYDPTTYPVSAVGMPQSEIYFGCTFKFNSYDFVLFNIRKYTISKSALYISWCRMIRSEL